MMKAPVMNKQELSDFLAGGEPTASEFFFANIQEGFDNSSLGVLLDSAKEDLAAGFDVKSQEGLSSHHGVPMATTQTDNLLKTLTADEWRKSSYFREGVTFKDGWSEGRAKYLAEGHDERKLRETILERGNKGFFSARNAIGLAGQMIGGLPDPINLIPFGSGVRVGGKLATKVAEGIVEGAAGNLAVSSLTRPYYAERGVDSDWLDYMNDIWIGGVMGGGISAVAHTAGKFFRREQVSLKDRAKVSEAADAAINAIARGEDLDLTTIDGLQETYNSVYDIPNVQRSRKVQDLQEQLIGFGYDADSARTHIAPIVAHAEVFSRDLGMSIDEFLEAHGPKFQKSEFSNGEIVTRQQRLIEDELKNMSVVLRSSEAGRRSGAQIINPQDGQGFLQNINTSTKSTYPEWYAQLGLKNKQEFDKVVKSKKGPKYERILKLAEDRLLNGADDGVHGFSAPHDEFRSLSGLESAEIPVGPDGQPLFQKKTTNQKRRELPPNDGGFTRINGITYPEALTPLKLDIEVTPDQGDLSQAIKGSIPSSVVNPYSKKAISLSDRTLRKLSSSLYQDIPRMRSGNYAKDLHYTAAMNLKELVETAIPFERISDKKGRKAAWEYYYNVIEINGERRAVQLQIDASGNVAEVHHFKVGVNERKARAVENATEFTRVSNMSLSEVEREINRSIGLNKYFQGDSSPRGALTMDKDGRQIIHILENADESTIIHETGHFFLNNMEKFSKLEGASAQLKADWDTIKAWAGSQPKVDPKHDTRTHLHETFARGFEKYLREGNAPRPELTSIFERFKEWLTSIYRSSGDLKVNLSDDAREVYARLIGNESRPKVAVSIPLEVTVSPFANVEFNGDIDATIQASPTAINELEVKALRESLEEIDNDLRGLDVLETYFQSPRNKQDLLDMANKAGMTQRDFQALVDDFNAANPTAGAGDKVFSKLREYIENKKRELVNEKTQRQRQADLSILARKDIVEQVDKMRELGATPVQAILSIMEGDSSLRGIEGAGKSVDGAYTALAQSTSSRCFGELRRIDSRIERLFEDDMQFNHNVIREMIEPNSTGDEVAARAGEILARYSEELRQRANLAGADIRKLTGHIPRSHDIEKMLSLGEGEWISFMLANLDNERTFNGMGKSAMTKELKEIWASLIADNHEVRDIAPNDPLARRDRNVAKGLGHERPLHFKDAEAELQYLRMFGQGDNILETMSGYYERMSRSIALMERLGPNPENTLAHTVQKIVESTREGIVRGKIAAKDAEKMLADLGTVDQMRSRDSKLGHAVMLALGESDSTQGWFKNASQIIRGVHSLSKLGSALLSQPGDFIHAINERRILSADSEAHHWAELFKDYFSRPGKELEEVLEHVGLYADAFNYNNFNRFGVDNVNNKLARANDWMFRWSGQNWHVKNSKKAAGLSLARELGANMGKGWAQISDGLREALVQYGGFTSTKWNVIKDLKALDVEGKSYFHPGLLRDLPDEALDNLLPVEYRKDMQPMDLPEVAGSRTSEEWDRARAEQLKRARFKLETDLKTFFVEEGRNAAPEPDARVRRIMNFGTKQGTMANQALKLLTQFKAFAFVNWDRSIRGRRFMRNPSDYGGLLHHVTATMALGYISTVLKELAKGLEPSDPSEGKTWLRAAFQSGGLGILGDFAQSGISARSGADAMATLAGPTMTTGAELLWLTGRTLRGDALEDGAKVTSQWVDFVKRQAPAPFSSLWYTRAAMDHLIWQNLKETLEPGSIRRSQRRLKKEYNQEYLVSPQSTQWLPKLVR